MSPTPCAIGGTQPTPCERPGLMGNRLSLEKCDGAGSTTREPLRHPQLHTVHTEGWGSLCPPPILKLGTLSRVTSMRPSVLRVRAIPSHWDPLSDAWPAYQSSTRWPQGSQTGPSQQSPQPCGRLWLGAWSVARPRTKSFNNPIQRGGQEC